MHINNGSGSFAPPSEYATNDAPTLVHAADLNGDGHPDLVIGSVMLNKVVLLSNDGQGKFANKHHSGKYDAYWNVDAYCIDRHHPRTCALDTRQTKFTLRSPSITPQQFSSNPISSRMDSRGL